MSIIKLPLNFNAFVKASYSNNLPNTSNLTNTSLSGSSFRWFSKHVKGIPKVHLEWKRRKDNHQFPIITNIKHEIQKSESQSETQTHACRETSPPPFLVPIPYSSCLNCWFGLHWIKEEEKKNHNWWYMFAIDWKKRRNSTNLSLISQISVF